VKLRVLLVLPVLAAAGVVVVSVALAAGQPNATCSGGALGTGPYKNVLVTGDCTFSGDTVVTGNLTVAPGATLNDHALSSATVHIGGNVIVGKGAVIGLGTYEPNSGTVVDGNVIGDQAATLYLGGITVHGNVIVNGGGDPGRNLPLKDDVIDGNLSVHGWSGLWFGIIRDTVGGNVLVQDNTATDPAHDPGADSTEVANNDIARNLVCDHNVPAAQIGDTGQPGNRVGGNSKGECAGL
jgi:hypothetical protein